MTPRTDFLMLLSVGLLLVVTYSALSVKAVVVPIDGIPLIEGVLDGIDIESDEFTLLPPLFNIERGSESKIEKAANKVTEVLIGKAVDKVVNGVADEVKDFIKHALKALQLHNIIA